MDITKNQKNIQDEIIKTIKQMYDPKYSAHQNELKTNIQKLTQELYKVMGKFYTDQFISNEFTKQHDLVHRSSASAAGQGYRPAAAAAGLGVAAWSGPAAGQGYGSAAAAWTGAEEQRLGAADTMYVDSTNTAAFNADLRNIANIRKEYANIRKEYFEKRQIEKRQISQLTCDNDMIIKFFKGVLNRYKGLNYGGKEFSICLQIVFFYLPVIDGKTIRFVDTFNSHVYTEDILQHVSQNDFALINISNMSINCQYVIDYVFTILDPGMIFSLSSQDYPDDTLFTLLLDCVHGRRIDEPPNLFEGVDVLCVYHYFKLVLNEYLNILININISFNTLANYTKFDTLVDSLKESSVNILPKELLRQQRLKIFQPSPSESVASSTASASGQGASGQGASGQGAAGQGPQVNSIAAYRLNNLQTLLMNTTADRLYYFMNSSSNTYLTDLTPELEEAPPDLNTFLNILYTTADKREFKKLYCALLIYSMGGMSFDELLSERFHFESFFYTYSILLYLYPLHIDNFEKYCNIANSHLNAGRLPFRAPIIFDSSKTMFNHINDALNTILNEDTMTEFLFGVLNNVVSSSIEKLDALIAQQPVAQPTDAFRDQLISNDPQVVKNKQNTKCDLDDSQCTDRGYSEVDSSFQSDESGSESIDLTGLTSDEDERGETPDDESGSESIDHAGLTSDKERLKRTKLTNTNPAAATTVFLTGFQNNRQTSKRKITPSAAQMLDATPIPNAAQSNPNPSANKRNFSDLQKGGSCEDIRPEIMALLLQVKYDLEQGHDLDSKRGREAVLGGENIFTLFNGAAGSINIYTLINGVFKSIVSGINTNLNGDEKMEKKFLEDYKANSSNIDEPMYLSTVIDAIALHCPERIDDFFYNPIVGFVLRDVVNNKFLYDLLNAKILQFYPYNEWYLFMKVKTSDGKTDLYLSVAKKPQREFNDTTLKLYEQDMGIGNSLDMTFQESAYIAAYDAIFPPGSNNNIDNFFENGQSYVLKPTYTTDLNQATSRINIGTIVLDPPAAAGAGASKIKINGSIWIIDVPKLMDPLNVEKPIHGTIFAPDHANATITKLYIGYPDTQPIGGNNAGNSQTVFHAAVDARYPPATQSEINSFLKALNARSVQVTIDAINLLLSVWINQRDIINNYQFILNSSDQIIGIKFSNAAAGAAGPFTYTVYVEDLTVKNICYAMITHFKTNGNPDASFVDQARIIQQMKNIQNHPNYIYKHIRDVNDRVSYELAIIASFKSFGDEGQRIASEKLGNYLASLQNMSEDSKHMWLLSSDRPLIAQGLLNNQPVIADLKIPHEKFGTTEELLFGKIDGIYSENGGILSNRRSLISVSKTTLELLIEARTELQEIKVLLDTKLGAKWNDDIDPALAADADAPPLPPAAVGSSSSSSFGGPPPPPPSIVTGLSPNAAGFVTPPSPAAAGGNPLDHNYWLSVLTAAIPQLRQDSEQEQLHKTVTLKGAKKFIGEMKQLCISLEYYTQQFNTLQPKQKSDVCIEYINSQIDHAISISIDATTYKNMLAFNSGGFSTRKRMLGSLRYMYDNIDFGPKLIDCHDIACQEFIKKITLYIDIIVGSPILNDATKAIIRDVYANIIQNITQLNAAFFEDVKNKIEAEVNAKENRSTREPKIIKTDNVTTLQELQNQRDEVGQILQKLQDEKKKALQKLQDEKKKAEDEQVVLTQAVAAAASAPKKNKSKLVAAAKAALKPLFSFIKERVTKEKTFLEEQRKLEEKIKKEAQKELAKVHTKDASITKQFLKFAKIKLEQAVSAVSGSGMRLGTSGGKRTRKNKRKYYKQYTKRQKKIYRRRSQRNLKHKRHKHTRRH
jgi:hypothetical protein